MKRIVIVGCGFAGLWAAIGAARKRYELKKEKEIEILVLNKNEYHGIRVCYYENDLASTQIPLSRLLGPVQVKYKIGEVTDIQLAEQEVVMHTGCSIEKIPYDRLILASGSYLHSAPLPGLKEYGFNVDTYESAQKLNLHLAALPKSPAIGRYTAVVVGGGFAGLEMACELVERLKNIAKLDKIRVIIIDRSGIGNTLGSAPKPFLHQALKALEIEIRDHTCVTSIQSDSVTLQSNEVIPTQTVIWTTGIHANPLTQIFPVKKDSIHRIWVDDHLRIPGILNCFAAGDVACAQVDDQHTSIMSCQHSRPQGRIAGHNVVADLFHQPLIIYRQEEYVTVLDLGTWGALYMKGWEREVISQGVCAKKIKLDINHHRIYPPLTENPTDLFNAAAPIIQPIPPIPDSLPLS